MSFSPLENLPSPYLYLHGLNGPNIITIAPMTKDLYTAVWQKALPDLLDLFQIRSDTCSIALDRSAFQHAGNRKSYAFRLELLDGKCINDITGSAVARDLDNLIRNNQQAQKLLKGQHVAISLGRSFRITMQCL